jgi:hypothetical protein
VAIGSCGRRIEGRRPANRLAASNAASCDARASDTIGHQLRSRSVCWCWPRRRRAPTTTWRRAGGRGGRRAGACGPPRDCVRRGSRIRSPRRSGARRRRSRAPTRRPATRPGAPGRERGRGGHEVPLTWPIRPASRTHLCSFQRSFADRPGSSISDPYNGVRGGSSEAPHSSCFNMPGVGLEPTRDCSQGILRRTSASWRQLAPLGLRCAKLRLATGSGTPNASGVLLSCAEFGRVGTLESHSG